MVQTPFPPTTITTMIGFSADSSKCFLFFLKCKVIFDVHLAYPIQRTGSSIKLLANLAYQPTLNYVSFSLHFKMQKAKKDSVNSKHHFSLKAFTFVFINNALPVLMLKQRTEGKPKSSVRVYVISK